MAEHTINIPIARLREARIKAERIRALAAAIIIKERFQNSTLYSDTTMRKALMKVLHCSFDVARQLEKDLLTFGYCRKITDKTGKVSYFVLPFRSHNKQSYHGYKETEHDQVYKLKYDKANTHTLREMRKLLRDILLMYAICAACKAAQNPVKNDSRRETATDGALMTQRALAKFTGLTKSTVSRYIHRLTETDKKVSKTKTVAECVIPVLNEETERQWCEEHPDTFFFKWYNKRFGNYSGWRTLPCRYKIIDDRWAETSFCHLLWRHKGYMSERKEKQNMTMEQKSWPAVCDNGCPTL